MRVMEQAPDVPVLAADGSLWGLTSGGVRRCQLEGCTGVQIHVRWPDGQWSWPCTKGMTVDEHGHWRIG